MPDKPTRIHVTVKSTPFAEDPEGAERYYAAIGRALVLWGRFEAALDAALLAIASLPGSDAIRENIAEAVPASMKKKAAMWRRAFNNLPDLADMQAAALALMDDAMDGARNRAIFTHSNWQGFASADPLTMKFSQQRHKGGKLLIYTHQVALPAVLHVQATYDALTVRLLPIAWNLSALSLRQVPDRPSKQD